MNVKILRISDPGKKETERIILEVTNDCDIGYYLIGQTHYTAAETVSSKLINTHWFSDEKVKKGDWVVLYSGSGKNSEKKNDDGTTSYFIYWGLASPIFIDDQKSIVVMEVSTWKIKGIRV
jgi:hypothetical protein